MTGGVYSEVFDTEIATAIGRIDDTLTGKAELESIEGSSDRSSEDTRDGGSAAEESRRSALRARVDVNY